MATSSDISISLAHELIITACRAGYELEDLAIMAESEDKLRQVLPFIRGHATLTAVDLREAQSSNGPASDETLEKRMTLKKKLEELQKRVENLEESVMIHPFLIALDLTQQQKKILARLFSIRANDQNILPPQIFFFLYILTSPAINQSLKNLFNVLFSKMAGLYSGKKVN